MSKAQALWNRQSCKVVCAYSIKNQLGRKLVTPAPLDGTVFMFRFLFCTLCSDVVTRVNDSTRLESQLLVTLTRLESRSAVSCDDSTRVTFFIK